MNICILDNDVLDPAVAGTYVSYAAMLERLLREAGADHWQFQHFHTPREQYPETFEPFDAVFLTGSRADAFSPEPWVRRLRQETGRLLRAGKRLVGVCFGHQLIALCLGSQVGRAPGGWVTGRQSYQWHAPDFPQALGRSSFALLASHQDQVFDLPPGTTLLASSPSCPVAAFAQGQQVLCVQPHPEFVSAYSAYLLDKRRALLGEAHYQASRDSLALGHDGPDFARMMVAFVQGAAPLQRTGTASLTR